MPSGQLEAPRASLRPVAAHIEKLNDMCNQFERNVDKLVSVLDRVRGTQPTPSTVGAVATPRAVPNGYFAEAENAVERLELQLSRFTALANELQDIL